jgi:hypothetical protein
MLENWLNIKQSNEKYSKTKNSRRPVRRHKRSYTHTSNA